MKKAMLDSFVIKGDAINIENDKNNVIKFLNSTGKAKQEAFAELYKRYSETIRFYMLKNVKLVEETADDLTQEVFTKVYEKMHLYRPDNAFSTWLFSIARNTLIDYKRSNKVEVLSFDSLKTTTTGDDDSSEAFFQIADKSATVDAIINKSERADAVRIAVESIKNPKQKQAIMLFFFEGLSQEEICKEMNECTNTVKGLIFRGKAAIEESLIGSEINTAV